MLEGCTAPQCKPPPYPMGVCQTAMSPTKGIRTMAWDLKLVDAPLKKDPLSSHGGTKRRQGLSSKFSFRPTSQLVWRRFLAHNFDLQL